MIAANHSLSDIIPGNSGFAISVCRLRERGCMSKSVYARVVHDLEFEICSVVRSNDSFNFPLGLIKYIVIAS